MSKKDKAKEIFFVIWKGDVQVMGVGVKLRAVQTVLEFLKRAAGAEYREGNHSFIVRMPMVEGDQLWLRQNCIGEGDIVGTTSVNDSAKRAERCMARYEERKGDTDRAGYGVLRYYLDHFYMKYDTWEED